MRTDRRAFLWGRTARAWPPLVLLRAQAARKRYPIAFSTLGCPAWSWQTVVDQADRLGDAAIELRGVAGEMDLPKVPELSGTRLAETKKELGGRGLVISDLGASANMHQKDPAARAKQFDEGRRFIDLAQLMGRITCACSRTRCPRGEARADVIARIVEGFQQMAAHAKPAGVVVLVESHGDFTNSKDLGAILSGRELGRLRPALGRPPHLRGRQGGAGGHPRRAPPLDPAYAPRGFPSVAGGRGPPLRAHGHGRGAGEGPGGPCSRRRATRGITAWNGRRSGIRRSKSLRSPSRTTHA